MTVDPHALVLVHYPRGEKTVGPDEFVYDPTRQYDPNRRTDKPTGLWVSVLGSDDWYEWCSREKFGVQYLHRPNSVSLTVNANILVLDSAGAVRMFADDYEKPDENPILDWRWNINWERVAVDYDGIIIAPYQWELREALIDSGQRTEGWYMSWDCASGCIWNLDVVQGVTALPEDPPLNYQDEDGFLSVEDRLQRIKQWMNSPTVQWDITIRESSTPA